MGNCPIWQDIGWVCTVFGGLKDELNAEMSPTSAIFDSCPSNNESVCMLGPTIQKMSMSNGCA